MAPTELFARMVQHISEYLEEDVSGLKPDAQLRNAVPGLDSLKTFEMMLYLEECFGVDFEENLLDNVTTLSDLADYIEAKLAAKSEAVSQ